MPAITKRAQICLQLNLHVEQARLFERFERVAIGLEPPFTLARYIRSAVRRVSGRSILPGHMVFVPVIWYYM